MAKVKVSEVDVVSVEKVGDISGKEVAMSKAGVTRRKAYEVIREMLEATKEVVSYNYKGEEVREIVADLDRRSKGVELALKAFGDMKDSVQVNTQVNNVFDVGELIKKARENRVRREK